MLEGRRGQGACWGPQEDSRDRRGLADRLELVDSLDRLPVDSLDQLLVEDNQVPRLVEEPCWDLQGDNQDQLKKE